MKIACVIPARYGSSRFEGKPLTDLLGRPMLWWGYQKVAKLKIMNELYIATDDQRIADMCKQYNMNFVMTSKQHPTGVDRLSEVAEKIFADYYILVQGDEPLIEGATIRKMFDIIKSQNPLDANCVYTFKTPVINPIDAINHTIIKIVTDLDNKVLLASRSPIPYPKAGIDFEYYKSVGVYAYPRDILLKYSNLPIGPLERAEDHDFMRLLENGFAVRALTLNTETISVDTPKDLNRIKQIMESRGIKYADYSE